MSSFGNNCGRPGHCFIPVMEVSREGFVILDHRFRISEVNPAYCRMIGYTEDELIGMQIGDLDAIEDPDLTAARIKRIVSNGSEIFETWHRRKDGSIIELEVSAIYQSEKPGSWSLICFCRNISDRKRFEAESAARLAMSEIFQQSLELSETYQKLAECLVSKLGFPMATISLYDANQNEICVAGASGIQTAHSGRCGSADLIFSGKVAITGQEFYESFLSKRQEPHFKHLQQFGIETLICVPVHIGHEVIGTITIADHRSRHNAESWVSNLATIATALALEIKRKQATQELEEEAIRRRILFEQAKDGIVIIGNDLEIIDANKAFADMLGYTLEETHQLHVWDWDINYPTREEFLEKWQASSNVKHTFETKHRRKDSSFYDVEISWNPAEYNDHKHLYCICRDITERKRAESAMQESEQQFRSLVEGSPIAIFVQTDLCISYANAATCKLLGVASPKELLGKPILDLVHPEFRERVKGRIQSLNEEKLSVETIEEIILRMDGNEIPVEASAVPIVYDGKEGALVFLRDITERKQAEADKEKSRIALQESEERLRLFIVHAPASLAMFDQNMRYLSVSHRWLFDYDLISQDIIGQSHYDIFPEIPEYWKKVNQRGLSGEVIKKDEDRFERLNGSVQWLRWEVRPWHTASGDVGGIVIFTEDITERKRTDEEKEKLQVQLSQAQKMESIGRLAGGVAHDFNNFLMAIVGYVELCRFELPPSHDVHKWLNEIESSVERSASLTRQLLTFARKQTVDPKVLDLNDAVSSMIKLLRRLIGEDIELEWVPEHFLWSIRLDPTQVDQILANLCINARDAISGIGHVTIETKNVIFDDAYCSAYPSAVPGEYVMLVVSDDGCGMEKDVLEHIFDPFFTTKEMGKGTGLGLATVYGIVKQNNGYVHVQSTPGEGTSFGIYLPRFKGEGEEIAPTKIKAPPKGHGEIVLLVEDDNTLRRTLSMLLESLDYTVLVAESPIEGMDIFGKTSSKIDLLLTDVIMPEMNGRELSDKLIAIKPDLKVLFMSGYTADIIGQHGILDEGVHFISKPFSLDELARKVRDILENT